MRKIRHALAMSLDGNIAGPNGEADWTVMDPAVNFGNRKTPRADSRFVSALGLVGRQRATGPMPWLWYQPWQSVSPWCATGP